ncbi:MULTISPECIES: hypothetical protein [unclassified Luteococcus]|uniref:hypothetical protein n=1 Tax=unclassified Luteococcus TaxID=2639923 RepID=UPI00313BC076
MTAFKGAVTLQCNRCPRVLVTNCTTVPGARKSATKYGWRVAMLAGGMHPTKASADPKAHDLRPRCAKGGGSDE